MRSNNIDRIRNYVKNQIKIGNHPSYRELNKKFHIQHKRITLNDIYPSLGIKMLDLKCKRPSASSNILKKELIKYIKNEVQLNHFPSRREIEHKFRLRLSLLFKGGINELYEEAGSKYNQKINQELKTKKADLLNKIVVSVLPKLKLTILSKRNVNQRGVDLITIDNMGRKIGVELKAYNKFEPIKFSHVKQASRFIKNEGLYRLLIITSTSKKERIHLPTNIEIIDYNKLRMLCKDRHLKLLEYIRETSVNVEPLYKLKKKLDIINYARNKANNGKDITYAGILKDLHLDLYSYFSDLNEIYKEAGLNIPSRKIHGLRSKNPNKEEVEEFIKRILVYIKKEIKQGQYPTSQDIKRVFRISHIWNIISMTELYRRIGKEPYLKRKLRI